MSKKEFTLDDLETKCADISALLKDKQPEVINWHLALNERLAALYEVLHPVFGQKLVTPNTETEKVYDKSQGGVQVICMTPAKSVVKKRTCKNCGVKVAYTPKDVKSYHGTDMGGGPDGCEWVVCPNCKEHITINSW